MNQLIHTVNDLRISYIKRNPPMLQIIAHGMAPTTGWSCPMLVPRFSPARPPADGHYVFEFRATPMARIPFQVLTPVTAAYVFPRIPGDMTRITVVASNNEMTEAYTGQPGRAQSLAPELADIRVYTGHSGNCSFDEALQHALSQVERPLDTMTRLEVISMEATIGGYVQMPMLYVTIQTV